MKQMILMLAVFGSFSINAAAQTNRTYYSNMQTQQMYENEQRGGTPAQRDVELNTGTQTLQQEEKDNLKMNRVQPYQGYRQMNNQTEQQLRDNNRKWDEISRDDLPYRSIPYDTSKNNGNCIGCGSGTMTDPHPWK